MSGKAHVSGAEQNDLRPSGLAFVYFMSYFQTPRVHAATAMLSLL